MAGNPHDTRGTGGTGGTGGTCFGDSGGRVYLGDEIVAVTSYGYTSNCRHLGGYQRLDIPRRHRLARHLRGLTPRGRPVGNVRSAPHRSPRRRAW
jgi:hypothetical protein